MKSFRFLHAADIHLDSPLKRLKGYPGDDADRHRTATREAFDRLIETAIDERVAFLVIAGDLYDGDWRDFSTGLYFVSRMARLADAGIPVYLLHGNHDAESVITKRLELPRNVHVFDAQSPSTFTLDGAPVALHGQSFEDPSVTRNLVPGYPEPVRGLFNVGVLHTALEGVSGHARYAPCSLAELTAKGYRYWALGHVHRGQVLHERPHVVYPGNLQGRHVREPGAKGACLVTVQDLEVTGLERLALDVVRWSVVRVSVRNAPSLASVNERVRSALRGAVGTESDGRLLVARIVLEGRTALHARLLASCGQLLAESRAAALALGDGVAWVENVVVATEPLAAASPDSRDPDLRGLQADASADGELIARLEADIGELSRRLPHEIRTGPDDPLLAFAVEDDFAALIDRLSPDLSAHLND